jgi:Tol biopolymer transport system component
VIVRTLFVTALLLANGNTVADADRHSKAPAARVRTVSVREGTELVAALSRDGKRIAFILLGQTWLVDRAGGEAVALTDVVRHPREESDLAWAPDSRRLAILAGEGDGQGLRILDTSTRPAALLGEWPEMTSVLWAAPTWSPDGTRITLSRVVPDPYNPRRTTGAAAGLWSVPAQGGARVRTAVPLRPAGTLAYAPDGQALVYSGPVAAAESDLWEIDLATGRERQLTADRTFDGYPAYSPDGRWIAFLSERSGSRQVWLMPRAGGEARPLTRGAGDVYLGPLSWLPDSRGVVYTAAGKIRVVSLDGPPSETIEFTADLQIQRWQRRRHARLPRPGERRQARGIHAPALSPDGKWIAFQSLGHLWMASVHGQVPRRLTRVSAESLSPRWSPDGTRLIFAAEGDLWLASTAGGPARRLAQTVGNESPPLWSPDGKRLACWVSVPGEKPDCRVIEIERQERTQTVPVPDGATFAWSPDGQRFAYLRERPDVFPEQSDIGWVDLGSGALHHVATREDVSALIGWTPRGDAFVFSSSRQEQLAPFRGERQLWRVWIQRNTVEEWNVPGLYAIERSSAAWTPDLSRVAYAVAGRGYHARLRGKGAPIRLPDPAPRFFSWSSQGHSLSYISGARLRLFDVTRGTSRTLNVAPRYQVLGAPPPLLIRNVRIIDGTGTAPSAPADLLVSGGRIRRIAPAGRINCRPLTREIDAAGRCLLPGLIDLHTHVLGASEWYPAAYVYHGVLAIRDMGQAVEWMQNQRERMETEEQPAPRIFMTGGQIVVENGIGTHPGQRRADVTDPASVRGVVAGVAAAGADILKPYYRFPLLDARVIEASHDRQLPVTSHFMFLSSLARGLNGKEHFNLGYREWTAICREDVLGALRAGDVLVTPTLLLYPVALLRGHSTVLPLDATLLDDAVGKVLYPPRVLETERQRLQMTLPEAIQARWRRNEGWDLDNVRRLREAGVRVATGTDIAWSPWREFGVHLEMELLVKAGFTPLQALQAGTLEGARGLGVDDQLGTIAAGKRADFIIVDGNPAVDIRDTRRIEWVVLGGRPYTRPEILDRVRRATAP